MARLFKLLLLVVLALEVSAATILVDNWRIDQAYAIKFSGTKAEGTFTGLTGTIVYNPRELATATMDVVVSASTISTGNSLKDKHARGENWLDVAKYPSIRFRSTSFAKTSTGYLVTGYLTLHGVTKAVAVPFQFSQPGGQGLFTGQFRVNRQDYGIKGSLFGFSVGDDIAVELRVPVSAGSAGASK